MTSPSYVSQPAIVSASALVTIVIEGPLQTSLELLPPPPCAEAVLAHVLPQELSLYVASSAQLLNVVHQ
jgi:hypothetical protein